MAVPRSQRVLCVVRTAGNPAPRGKPVMAVQTLTESARVDQLWQRVLRSKPLSVGSCCLTWFPPASISRTSSHLTTNGARNCRYWSTATAAGRLASACFRPACGRSRATPPNTESRRAGNFERSATPFLPLIANTAVARASRGTRHLRKMPYQQPNGHGREHHVG